VRECAPELLGALASWRFLSARSNAIGLPLVKRSETTSTTTPVQCRIQPWAAGPVGASCHDFRGCFCMHCWRVAPLEPFAV
jgi:hypothetical protein